MSENVLDVLMYLFETFVDADDEPEPDRDDLRLELSRAGFGDREIDRALDWLDGLHADEPGRLRRAPTSSSLRVYDRREQSRLDAGCRGYLMYLEQVGILTADQRELVLDRLMALDGGEIDIEQIKWVVLMVLFSQPGQEAAYARMEDLVFSGGQASLH
jgi:Smg protein